MASYRLFYWPQIPGRGEFVRLAFAAAKVPLPEVNDVGKLVALTSADGGVAGHEPQFAVPVLEVQPERQAPFYLSQTGNILQFVAKRFGLDGEQPGIEADVTHAQVLQFTLTGLDWALEAHNVHHPISVALYYEDQKPEALRYTQAFVHERIPKFAKRHNVRRLVGTKTSVADLVLFQVLEGLRFAHPRAMQRLQDSGDAADLEPFRAELAEELKEYLGSARRRPFSDGLFRYYSELDL